MRDARLHLRLNANLLTEVRKLCKRKGLTLTFVIESQLRRFLAEAAKETEVEQA